MWEYKEYFEKMLSMSRLPKMYITKSAFTCSKVTIYTLEQGVKYVPS